MTRRAQPAHIEILEYTPAQSGSGHIGVLKANELRINGTPILCPKGETIRVHAMEFNQADGYRGDEADLVKVTVTMFAHRVLIEQRGEDTAENRAQEARARAMFSPDPQHEET